MLQQRDSAWPTQASLRELLALAWPLILSNSCWTLQIVLDRVLLSQSSTEDIGAGLQAAVFFWTIMTLFQYTANYATTFVAQYTGANQHDRVGPVVGQSLWFALLGGGLFLLLLPLAQPMTQLAGHDPALQRLETIYFRCLCFAGLPTLVTAASCSFFAGRGDSRTVLIINLTGLLVNGICAWVLIFGRYGFPALGIAGAGWATVAGSSTSGLLGLLLLLLPKYRREFGNGWGWRFDRALFFRLMRFGVPQGIGVALETLAFSIFLLFIGRIGKTELAATSIACTLNLFAFLPMLGVGQAIEVLVGQRLGENRPTAAAQATWSGLILSVGFTGIIALAYVVVPSLLIAPFESQSEGWPEVAVVTLILLRFVAVYCLFDSLNLVFSFALRGAGDTKFVSAVAVALSWPIMVLPTVLVWWWGNSLYWAWGFASVYIMTMSLIFLRRFLQDGWRSLRVIEHPPALDSSDSSHSQLT